MCERLGSMLIFPIYEYVFEFHKLGSVCLFSERFVSWYSRYFVLYDSKIEYYHFLPTVGGLIQNFGCNL